MHSLAMIVIIDLRSDLERNEHNRSTTFENNIPEPTIDEPLTDHDNDDACD
jgi:hypothetical protein